MINLQTRIKLDGTMHQDGQDVKICDARNLCSLFTEYDLAEIGGWVWDGYTHDQASRMPWQKRMQSAMDFAMQVQKAKSFPWPGCSNVIFPLITIGALQFSSQAYPALVPGMNIVRYRVIGKDQGEVRERAKRIGRHMSWQVLEEDEGWEEQHDRLLINLAIVGTNFIKSRFNPARGYPVDELVMAQDLVVDYGAKSIESAARKTQIIPLYRNEILERCRRGVFRKAIETEDWFKGPPPQQNEMPSRDKRRGVIASYIDAQSPFKTFEQHCLMDADGDGYEEPYVITIEESSQKVLRIVSRWEGDHSIERNRRNEVVCIKPEEYYTKFSFIPSPDGGFYDFGFGTFLGPINEAVNTGINQMLDNGTLQNSIGGFLGRGAKIRGGVYTMAPFEWKRVDSTGDDLRKNIVPFPERKASDTLYQLVVLLINYANRLAGTTDTMVGENPGQNTPAQSYQGMLEQGTRIYQWIFKRVWRSLKEEFKKRYDLNRRYTPLHRDFGDGGDFIRREDYKGSPDQVAPVANPRVTSTVLRVQQAIAVKQDSHITEGYDQKEVTESYLEALGVDGIERLYPGPGKVPPLPNPKAMEAQLKGQIAQLNAKVKMTELAQKLQEDRRLNNAKIAQLEAQALNLLKQAGTRDVELAIQAFDSMVNHLKEHSAAMDSRIQSLMGEANGNSDSGGGVPSVANGPNDSGAEGVSAPAQGSNPGPVGGGGTAE